MARPRQPQSVASSRRARWELWVGVVLALGLAAWYSYRPYWSCGFALDDYDFQRAIGLVQTGETTWASFLFERWGPRLMPLWKLSYAAAIVVAGCNEYAMHIFNWTLHVLSALLLVVLLRRLAVPTVAAAAGATFWAGAAVGNMDNPGIWPLTGYVSLSLVILLTLTILLTYAADGWRWHYYMAIALATLALVLVDSPNLLFVPFLLAYSAVWFRGKQFAPVRRRLLISLGAPFLLVVPWAILSASAAMSEHDRQRQFEVVEIWQRTGAELGVSLGTLLYSLPYTDSLLGEISIATVAVVLAAVVLQGAHRKLFLAMLAMTSAHVLSFNLGGVNQEFQFAVNSGRYLYFPTLFWCLLAALVLGRLLAGAPRGLAIVWCLIVVLVPLHLRHQRAVAEQAVLIYDQDTVVWRTVYQRQRHILERLAQRAQREGHPLALADMPVRMPTSMRLVWPASAFTATCVPAARPHLNFYDSASNDDDPNRQLALMQACEDPGQPSGWENTLSAAMALRSQFTWLVECGRARGVAVSFPNIFSNLGGIQVCTDSFLCFYGLQGAGAVEVVDGESACLASVDSMLRLVQTNDDPRATAWQQQLASLRTEILRPEGEAIFWPTRPCHRKRLADRTNATADAALRSADR
ncbi:MAG: hypothetical protein K2Y37_02490 [Pirellulales bacterium]|nr:hypothetical protein [Pirellulales bacterium]